MFIYYQEKPSSIILIFNLVVMGLISNYIIHLTSNFFFILLFLLYFNLCYLYYYYCFKEIYLQLQIFNYFLVNLQMHLIVNYFQALLYFKIYLTLLVFLVFIFLACCYYQNLGKNYFHKFTYFLV
jgi:hypothetical protein